MLCNNCKTENTPGVKFCHSCGKPLECSMIDRYSELKLKPTSVCKLKRSYLLAGVIAAIVIFFSVAAIAAFIDEGRDDFLVAFIVFVFIPITIIWLKIFRPQNLKSVADYFQTTNKKHVIIIKDEKFGLYNRNKRKVTVPCEYSYLQWKSGIGILSVTTTDGQTFDIDIHNNRLK